MKRSEYVAAALFLPVTLVLAALLNVAPYLQTLELKAYDYMMAYWRGVLEAPDDIVIVAIDEDSISEFELLGIDWPWPRDVHARLIRVLNEAGARIIGFDVTFFGRSPCPECAPGEIPEADRRLAEAIRESRIPVVLAASRDVVDDPRFGQTRLLMPHDLFLEAGAEIGFATLNPEPLDSVIREARLSVENQPTLVTQILKDLGQEPEWERAVVSYEGQDPKILVNYVGGPRSIRTVYYYQALDFSTSLPADTFRGKIVLVGRSLSVQDVSGGSTEADVYPSPFNLHGEVADSTPGVEVHANILNTLLRENFIYPYPPQVWQSAALLLFLASLLSILVLAPPTFRLKIGLSLAVILGYSTTVFVAFVNWNVWLPTVRPVAVMVLVFGLNTLYQYRLSERERARIRRAFKGYVSPQVMREVLENPAALELGGTQVEATVLFSDIQDFTSSSEEMPVRQVAELLNDYFTLMGDVIMQHRGMINKYIGDSIMAVWGAPLPDPDHALRACLAALEMKRIIDRDEKLKSRIGINCGSMMAGNLGHRERMEYTVVGDAVNIASRLEGANRAFGSVILISESTEKRVRERVLCRPVGRVRFMGREQPVPAFELLADRRQPSSWQDLVDSFEAVLAHYEKRAWGDAVQACLRHLERFPEDKVAISYLQRCRRFQAVAPPPDWRGVWELEFK